MINQSTLIFGVVYSLQLPYLGLTNSRAMMFKTIDLGTSKLSLRSTRITLLVYFGRKCYKILNQRTDIIYNDEDNLLKYRPRNRPIVKDLANKYNCNNIKSIVLLFQK